MLYLDDAGLSTKHLFTGDMRAFGRERLPKDAHLDFSKLFVAKRLSGTQAAVACRSPLEPEAETYLINVSVFLHAVPAASEELVDNVRESGPVHHPAPHTMRSSRRALALDDERAPALGLAAARATVGGIRVRWRCCFPPLTASPGGGAPPPGCGDVRGRRCKLRRPRWQGVGECVWATDAGAVGDEAGLHLRYGRRYVG